MTTNLFRAYCRSMGLPEPVTEYRFGAIASGGIGKGLRERLKETGLKDWRMDYAWPDQKVALEVEGGVWVNGAHNRPAHFLSDMAKYNAAGAMGWIVLRCQPKDLMKATTVEMVKRAMVNRRNSYLELV